MSPRRRRPAGPPRCRDCKAPVVFLRGPHSDAYRPFEPKEYSGRDQRAAGAFPIFAQRAWRFRELVLELQALRHCSQTEAESEARDVPWRRTHNCPNRPHHAGDTDAAEPAREDPNP